MASVENTDICICLGGHLFPADLFEETPQRCPMIVTNFPIDIDVTNTVYECGLPVTVEEREVQYQEFPSWWRNRFNSLQHALHFKIGP